MRLEKVLKEMQKRQLTHLIINDPSSIDYLINYKNNPGERMYLLLLSSDGHHKLFMNNLFYLDHELDIEQVWYSDTDNYLQLLADEFDGACSIGIDKNFPARFLIPLMNLVDECHFELGSECVDRVRMIKDEKEQQLMIEASKINDLVVDEVINICAKGDLTEEEVSKQLEGMGFLRSRKNGVQKILLSENSAKELFYKAEKVLLNPVKRTVYVPCEEVKSELLESGYFALAEYSMLNAPSVRCYASEKISQWNDCMTKDLQDSNSQVAVEMWRYDPRKLSKGKMVDGLSLALSLREDADERVEEAVEEMLNNLWRKIDGNRD